MSESIDFKIKTKGPGLLRTGVIKTPHGEIKTPSFVVVGTKATVKALTTEQVKALGGQTILANTYHLLLEPGPELVAEAGGLHQFMNYNGPMWTDSGGFQVFSLGAAYGEGGVSKFTTTGKQSDLSMSTQKPAMIDDEGVTFKSPLNGSLYRLTPAESMRIQHLLGADLIFAFDECTSPQADYNYQKQALKRTHLWAEKSLEAHLMNTEAKTKQGLLGIVQGGKYEDLRLESARFMAQLEDLAGFGIGGSFTKNDLGPILESVTTILPETKPRHLLGIGEPEDLLAGIAVGIDTFDCVTPTRIARNGTLYTKFGKINISNTQFRSDFSPLDSACGCYTCLNYSRAYLAHLFRAKEMLASTLASIHNLYFIVNLVDEIRQAIDDNKFFEFSDQFLQTYKKSNG